MCVLAQNETFFDTLKSGTQKGAGSDLSAIIIGGTDDAVQSTGLQDAHQITLIAPFFPVLVVDSIGGRGYKPISAIQLRIATEKHRPIPHEFRFLQSILYQCAHNTPLLEFGKAALWHKTSCVMLPRSVIISVSCNAISPAMIPFSNTVARES